MAADEREARKRRAARRAAWAGALRELQDTDEIEFMAGTAAERVGIVRELTLAAWAMRAEPLPDYAREEAPGRVLRPAES